MRQIEDIHDLRSDELLYLGQWSFNGEEWLGIPKGHPHHQIIKQKVRRRNRRIKLHKRIILLADNTTAGWCPAHERYACPCEQDLSLRGSAA